MDVFRHECRRRVPHLAPAFSRWRAEQLTAGVTEEEGIAVSPDGTSLVTAVGTRRISVVLRDGGAERAIVSEGRPRLAAAQNGSPFSPDGKKLYYLQIARGSNDVGEAMLTPFTSGELWAVDVDSGQAEAVFPGLSITRFSLARDGKRITFTTADSDGPHLWIAALDRQSPPRQLPVTSPESPRFAGEYIYYLAREPAAQGALRPVVHRIRVDGRGDERIWTKGFWRVAISPSGRHLALTARIQSGSRLSTGRRATPSRSASAAADGGRTMAPGSISRSRREAATRLASM